MIVALDNSFLTLLLNSEAAPRPNPKTGKSASHCRERILGLIDELSRGNGRILIPAPCLAEAFARSEAAEAAYLEELQSYSAIEIAEFNGRAAFELGRVIRGAKAAGDKRSGQDGAWQNIKMDRMIVGIAVAHGVSVFYSDDDRQANFARMAGLNVIHSWDLPLPDDKAQHSMSDGNEDQWPEHAKAPGPQSPKKPHAN